MAFISGIRWYIAVIPNRKGTSARAREATAREVNRILVQGGLVPNKISGRGGVGTYCMFGLNQITFLRYHYHILD
jgi:hypothetical protein